MNKTGASAFYAIMQMNVPCTLTTNGNLVIFMIFNSQPRIQLALPQKQMSPQILLSFLQTKTLQDLVLLEVRNFTVDRLDTNLIEKTIVNPMIIPKRFSTSFTIYRTNIGIVVSSGARRVQTISAAVEIPASLYSVTPSSSSMGTAFSTISLCYSGVSLTHLESLTT